MALDRDAIVRRDFPVARRGYEQSAVDAHLQRVATEVDELRRAPAPAGMADAASEQVRTIVAAAEESAAGIEAAARAEAEATVARAGDESRAEVARVRDVVGGLLERLRAIDGELAALERSLGALHPAPPRAQEPRAATGDTEGARLVALSMALDGRPRDEVDRHLAENFDVADRDALLDEVFATVEG